MNKITYQLNQEWRVSERRKNMLLLLVYESTQDGEREREEG